MVALDVLPHYRFSQKTMRNIGRLIPLLILALTIGCDKKILIGVSLPLSGPNAETGKEMLQAVQLHVDSINEKGGIGGKKVGLVIKDDEDDPAKVKKAAEELAGNSNVVGVIGHLNSPTVIAAAEVYDKTDLVAITPVSTNTDLSTKTKNIFMLNRDGVYQGQFMVDYLKGAMGKSHPIVFVQESRYGLRHWKGFEERAGELSITPVKVIRFKNEDLGTEAFAANLTQDPTVDSIILLTDDNADVGLKLLTIIDNSKMAPEDTVMLAPESYLNPKYTTKEAERYTDTLYVCTPFLWEIANQTASAMREAYEAKYKMQPGLGGAMAFDAAMLLTTAIAEKGTDRKLVHEYLLEQKRKDLQAKRKDLLVGATAELVFGEGRFADRDLFVAKVEHGRYKVAFTQLATVKEPYVIAQLPERIANGSVIDLAGTPYHVVDVIFMGLDILKLNSVNTKDMRFEVEFFMWYKWASKAVDPSQIDAVNGAGDLKTTLLKERTKKGVTYRALRCKGTFNTQMDFSQFPFDRQGLEMSFVNKVKHSAHLFIVPDTRHMTHDPLKGLPLDWTFIQKKNYTGLLRYDSTFGDPDYRMGAGYKSRILFSTIGFRLDVQRVPTGFAFTMFVPLVVILVASFFVISAPIEELKGRLPLGLTALLTVVLSRMALASQTPSVAYIMRSDYFYLTAFLYVMGLIAVLSGVIWLMAKKNDKGARLLHKFFVMGVSPLVAVVLLLQFIL